MKKKIVISIIILAVTFSIGIALKTKAGTNNNGTGWFWGGGAESDGSAPWDGTNTNVGWISMNSTNCDTNGNGSIDAGDTPPTGCPPIGTTVADYGVNIPTGNGNVTGYAWSENLGYINFDPAGPYPAAPNNSVIRNGNDLEGWARITGIEIELAAGNSGGWEGWIKMKGATYGVSIIPATGALTGFASAGKDELGWIDFKQASIVTPETLKVCENTCDSGIMRAVESIPDSLSVTEGDSDKNLRACYNNDLGCGDSNGDITLDANTTWTETPVTGDAFSLAVVAPNEVMSFNAVAADTTENLTVVYNDAGTPRTAAFDVTVTNICLCKACNASNNCVDTTYAGASCPCADSCTVTPNSCAPLTGGSNWKEIAP